MTINAQLTAQSLSRQSTAVAWALPQVIAHRLTRIAGAGIAPSAVDREEFSRMGSEKLAAFNESWQAMARASWFAGGLISNASRRAWLKASRTASLPDPTASLRALSNAGLSIVAAGYEPVSRRVVANASRLGKVKLKRKR